MKLALLLIDLQEDYLADAALEPHRAAVVAGASRILAECRTRGAEIFHILTTVRREPDQRMEHWKSTGRWLCEEGTPGHAVAGGMEPLPGEEVFHKTAFSAFTNQEFATRLEAFSPGWILVAGVHTHACVRQTALDAYQRGMQVCIVSDAIGSPEPLHAAQTEIYLRRRSVEFLGTAEILRRLDGDSQAHDPGIALLPALAGGSGNFSGSGAQSYTHLAPATVGAALWKSVGPSPEQIGEIVREAKLTGNISDRLVVLKDAANLLRNSSRKFAALMTSDIGKPIQQSRDEVERAAALFEAVARRLAETPMERKEPEAMVVRRPHGVIAVITPWNNPIAIFAGQLAPAFACGNAVVWKPAWQALRIALEFREVLLKAGIPPSALQIVGGGDDAGMELAAHPRIDAVCFTGSNRNGWKVSAVCAANQKPLQAELGGNNAAIVWQDARDLDSAVRAIVTAAFGFSGQRCTATRRVIFPAAIFDRGLEALKREIAFIFWGQPDAVSTAAGPLISSQAVSRVSEVVERARCAGHVVLQPHVEQQRDLPGQGAYYPPTLVVCDDPTSEIVQEETFGPVLVVQRGEDWSHCISLLNGVRYGLAAALFSSDRETQRRFLREANAGILKINQSTAGAGVDVPFGGWKRSGIGVPQHGCANVEFFTKLQSVYDDEAES